MSRAIILMGCKGSGKTTLGALLAKEMGFPFVDVDNVIQKMYGMTPKDIYTNKGVSGFLFAEENACKKITELAKGKDVIISTGGGICENAPALLQLQDDSTFVFLEADVAEVVQRIVAKASASPTGLLDNLPAYVQKENFESEGEIIAFLNKLYEERNVQYKNFADMTVCIKNASIKDSLSLLKKALGLG